jgi:formylglycine-generating enzyme required for sulfatase activity
VTCLHLLTQVSPFDLYSIDEGDWVWRDFLHNNPVSDKLGNILDKLIESAIKRRYQTVNEVLNDISEGKRSKTNTNINTSTSVSSKPIPKPKIKNKSATSLGKSIVKSSKSQKSSISQSKKANSTAQTSTVVQTTTPSLPKTIIEILSNNVKLEMVLIPAGSFMMGSNEYKNEQPIHEVTLKAFYMGKYPITQAQYEAVMGNNPSHFQTESKGWFSTKKEPLWEHPVESVSWNDAKEFCRKLSQLTGENYQLPSEAQWEYACRAGSTTRYYFGDSENQLKDYAWYITNSNSHTHPVGQKKPNNWGLFDMHGNVWEWCEDNYVDNYKNTPRDGTAHKDQSTQYFVLRGGSWGINPNNRRSANRVRYSCVSNFKSFGFRVILVV